MNFSARKVIFLLVVLVVTGILSFYLYQQYKGQTQAPVLQTKNVERKPVTFSFISKLPSLSFESTDTTNQRVRDYLFQLQMEPLQDKRFLGERIDPDNNTLTKLKTVRVVYYHISKFEEDAGKETLIREGEIYESIFDGNTAYKLMTGKLVENGTILEIPLYVNPEFPLQHNQDQAEWLSHLGLLSIYMNLQPPPIGDATITNLRQTFNDTLLQFEPFISVKKGISLFRNFKLVKEVNAQLCGGNIQCGRNINEGRCTTGPFTGNYCESNSWCGPGGTCSFSTRCESNGTGGSCVLWYGACVPPCGAGPMDSSYCVVGGSCSSGGGGGGGATPPPGGGGGGEPPPGSCCWCTGSSGSDRGECPATGSYTYPAGGCGVLGQCCIPCPGGGGGGGGGEPPPAPPSCDSLTISPPGLIQVVMGQPFSVSVNAQISNGSVTTMSLTSANPALLTVTPAGGNIYTLTDNRLEGSTTITAFVTATGPGGSTSCPPATSQVTIIPPPAWWQNQGDVLTGGDLSSLIPPSCVLPGCNPYFIKDDPNGIPGVAFYNGTTADFAYGLPSGNVSTARWIARSPANWTPYSYAKFLSLVPSSATFNALSGVVTGTTLRSNRPGDLTDARGYTWYRANGNLTIQGNTNLPAARKVILFVDGNLTIGGRITFANNTNFFMAIVQGSTNVLPTVGSNDPNLMDLSGIYYSDGTFSTGTQAPIVDLPLKVSGSVVATNITLERNLRSGNVNTPGETFHYANDLLLNYPTSFSQKRLLWTEVAP